VSERAADVAFEGKDPTVVIIGGGHVGLEVAARLKYLDVPTLVLEKNSRIGDNWRNRYDGLCFHDPVRE
jgi:cation diffusion facilitator CzcD-associated flavoprotein CzcO